MKKLRVIYAGILLVLLVGCTKEEGAEQTATTKVNGDLEEQLSQLNEQLIESENKIKELYVMLESRARDENEAYNELHNKIYIMENLLSRVPGINSRQGFVKDVNTGGATITLEVKFAEKKEDNEAPNGFVIEEQETKIVTVDLDANYFILKGDKLQTIPTADEFKEAANEYDRFFNIYIVENKIVMLTEQYLP
ncbi:hypothetical protein M3152_04730 [Sporosarcina luteola]|uniref:hypothetical protein n=1 Tax=Sporosarcina luteola TaxID=582850 RepID=UPI00203E4C18|nr:hypothetical protein [Sporosarcina luteola]MCM3637018.1 hypothetical protein [Sporosarcina luteola]